MGVDVTDNMQSCKHLLIRMVLACLRLIQLTYAFFNLFMGITHDTDRRNAGGVFGVIRCKSAACVWCT